MFPKRKFIFNMHSPSSITPSHGIKSFSLKNKTSPGRISVFFIKEYLFRDFCPFPLKTLYFFKCFVSSKELNP